MIFNVIELTREEFYKLYEQCQANLQVKVEIPAGLNPEEKKAYIQEKLNPPIPLFIDEHTADGINRYVRKRKAA